MASEIRTTSSILTMNNKIRRRRTHHFEEEAVDAVEAAVEDAPVDATATAVVEDVDTRKTRHRKSHQLNQKPRIRFLLPLQHRLVAVL